VIALTLLAVMLALLFGGLRTGIRAWEVGSTRGDQADQVLLTTSFVRKELTATYPWRFKDPLVMKLAFRGTPEAVRFVSMKPADLGGGGLAFVAFAFERERERGGDGGRLVMRRSPASYDAIDFSTVDATDPFALLEGVARRSSPISGRRTTSARRPGANRGRTSSGSRRTCASNCPWLAGSSRHRRRPQAGRGGGVSRGDLPAHLHAAAMDEREPPGGCALILVIWVVTLLVAIAGSFLYAMRTDARAARNAALIARADALAQAAVARALYEIFKPANAPEVWKRDEAPRRWSFDGVEVSVRLSDESAKIDINTANDELLRSLFRHAGLAEDEAAKLLDAVLDWRDPDSFRRPNGAEEPEYVQAGLKVKPANYAFQATEELQLVLGMRPEVYQRIATMITVHSRQTGVNPHRPAEVCRHSALSPEHNDVTQAGRGQNRPADRRAAAYTRGHAGGASRKRRWSFRRHLGRRRRSPWRPAVSSAHTFCLARFPERGRTGRPCRGARWPLKPIRSSRRSPGRRALRPLISCAGGDELAAMLPRPSRPALLARRRLPRRAGRRVAHVPPGRRPPRAGGPRGHGLARLRRAAQRVPPPPGRPSRRRPERVARAAAGDGAPAGGAHARGRRRAGDAID
jgi:hypothetical protein